MNAFVAPEIQWAALSPLLIVLLAGVVGVLVEAFVGPRLRRPVQLVLSIGAVLGSLVAIALRWLDVAPGTDRIMPQELVGGAFIEDPAGLAAQAIIALCGFVALLVIADRTAAGDGAFVAHAADRPGSAQETASQRAGLVQTELFPLVLFALGGMMAFPVAGTFVTLFVALEVLSLPLYVLTAMARRRRLLSQEAALKYFLLGAFASAFTLMGIAFLYGYAGSLRLSAFTVAPYPGNGPDELLLGGIVLVTVGLLFKIGAAPFHSWTPDVYQGAPTPITGFMAAGTKAAATFALVRFFYVVGISRGWDLTPLIWIVAITTMVVGTVMGVVQSDVKRMLAYSSVAHAGFILIAVFSMQQQGIAASLFYLLAYGLASVGAFAVIYLVREVDADGNVLGEATNMNQWAGLGQRHPVLAALMSLFLLSFAGIPLTAGFLGKYLAFSAGIAGGATGLVVVAILCSAATAYFYVRLILLMYFTPAQSERVVGVKVEGPALVALALTAAATVILGVYPAPVIAWLENAAFLLP
ncbi:NADH-quinone oxidoreductase subunit NuoN [Buchananella felis]|uniref:NADH-quinone oxidoreductase subunit NuoN n=1 Tax=Buchananella felis TaxID=3231492 RepID=UPI00352930F4